ncbi:tRNA-guanine transglycosylase [Limosilactobacillus pontis]|uniref:tRNA-guanine transglycosylase n=1 Tax=Limosilactobacillus pontis TaxID=35787 RepID=UPI002F262A6A
MKKLTFQINHHCQEMRTGTVTVNGRQLTTPAVVQTGSALTTLTPAELAECGVQAIKQDAIDYWLTASHPGDLHAFLGWSGILVTASGADRAYQWAKPRGRKHDGVSFHDPVSGQLKFYTPQDARAIQRGLGADLTTGFARADAYFAPVDDLNAAVEQTNGWLTSNPCLAGDLAPLVGGGLKWARQTSLTAVPAGASGYSILGVTPDVPVAEQGRLLNELVGMMEPTKLRYLPTSGDLHQLVAALLCGLDLIDSDLAGREAAMGNAIVGFGRLPLDRERFAGDGQALADRCNCPTCRAGVSRAAIHHLLTTSQPVGERYLLLHNLFTINQLLARIRVMIAAGQISADLRKFTRQCGQ